MNNPQVAVRAVLYTDDMEPITVLELSGQARHLIEKHGVVVLSVIESISCLDQAGWKCPRPRKVAIRGEAFVRRGVAHLMLFTQDEESALLLKSAFLPGQRRELADQRAQAFGEGFLRALMEVGR